ncbi:MAG: single-stranded-DNA-specific exonuclease RecJ [Candidatus Omnitrophica bacterium]|nr:single-stranded-DNA-specific exonuclease RecJ [Candidatus Omnitrophota bacterium]
MQTAWALRTTVEPPAADWPLEISRLFGVSLLTARLLAARGFSSESEIRKYLYPKLEDLAEPFLVPGIPEAVEIVRKHLRLKNPILIHGDYDADGITASAVLVRAFKKLGAEPLAFIPHRLRHGYGLTRAGIDFARDRGAQLMITVDCGITAHEPLAEARAAGIDVIITDHHQISPLGVPPASAIIHPLLDDAGLPFRDLSAVGLAFKLAQALLGEDSYDLLDLAALGTVGDMAPLQGENRMLVKHGLEALERGGNLGLKILAETAKLRAPMTASHLGYVLGPRINASGRVDSADNALQLLISGNAREARSLAGLLEEENKLRQKLERDAAAEAVRKVEREVNFNRDRLIVVWDAGWHPGVVGIVASRLVEKFYRPAVVIGLDGNGGGRGSARSIAGFNIHQALMRVSDLLVECGGHEQAAGLKIRAENLELFRSRLNEAAAALMDPSALVKNFHIDCELRLSDITAEWIREILLLEPFGIGAPKPLFLTRGLRIKDKPAAWGRESLKFWVEQEANVLEAVWSRPRPFPWAECGPVDAVYTVEMNRWNGMELPRLEIRDLKPTS